jgi:hypothetical protein
MCFSVTASFVSGTALVCAGAYYLKQQGSFSEKHYLALIPFLFGIQQLLEGVVWLGVAEQVTPMLKMIAAYGFSFMATSLWPAYMPFAMYMFEEKRPRFLPLMAVGFLLAVYLLWSSMIYSPIRLEVMCNQIDCFSLAYLFDAPYMSNSINFLYLFLVVIPFVLSSNKRVRYIVAPAFFISFVFGAFLSKSTTFPSVWCFFAAIMSISIFSVSIAVNKKSDI